MLEVKNLTKVYTMKGGVQVRALDGVTLSFPETGMVFLLGKSGSGKSTLLNVCGGLDSPDGGEIIVKGRSSKDFSAGDFDSYRNTYVGFIFQEYNILNEFTVEDNIALALELQGKPKDKELIQKLLNEVELGQFAKRKPNTLSGGQKQRVAIARALVKNPEVIMADEPTGALDSNTGKQVFDTLKHLSKNKLVIVVSHDREFAEMYADRIIELKDGKVISDIVKSSQPAVKASANFNIVGNDTLIIPKGSALSMSDLQSINNFLSKTDKDVFISRDSKENANFKKLAKINDDNSQDSFEQIKAQPKQKTYTKEESKFIGSKLPLRHAIKIGASNIKVKPVRFTFTVLLSIISFVMFGLFSCLMFFNPQAVTAQSLANSNTKYLFLNKMYEIINTGVYEGDEHTYTDQQYTKLTPSDIEYLKQQYGELIYVYAKTQLRIDNLEVEYTQSYYYNEIYNIVDGANLTYTIGSAPKDNEVAVSQYIYDSIKSGTLKDENNQTITVKDNSVEGIKLMIDGQFYTVSGVYQNENIDTDLFNEDMDIVNSSNWHQKTVNDFIATIAVNQATASAFADYGYSNSLESDYLSFYFNDRQPYFNYNDIQSQVYLHKYCITQSLTYYSVNGEKVTGTLPNESILVPDYEYMMFLSQIVDNYNIDQDNEQMRDDLYKTQSAFANFYNENSTTSYAGFENDYKTIMTFITTYIDKNFAPQLDVLGKRFTIAGMTTDKFANVNQATFDSLEQYAKDNLLEYKKYTTNYNPQDGKQAIYSAVYFNIEGKGTSELQKILSSTATPHEYSQYQYNSYATASVSGIAYMIESISSIFLWLGIALAVLAMLLLFNFISVSVANKKREIGILRAVGARGTDVFKIFFSESAIIVAICSVVSLIATMILSGYINQTLTAQLGNTLSLLVFNWVSVAMIVGIAVLTAFIATFLPVYTASRKKPVETIRSN